MILLFGMSIFLISPIFAEPVDVEIDWIIEGQNKSESNSSPGESPINDQNTDESNADKQTNVKPTEILTEIEPPEDFITGSGLSLIHI